MSDHPIAGDNGARLMGLVRKCRLSWRRAAPDAANARLHDRVRHQEQSADFRRWLLLPAALLILAVLVVPVAMLLLRGFSYPSWGLQNFRTVFNQPVYGRIIWTTLSVSLATTMLCLLLGYPLAYAITHASPRARKLLILAIVVPLWTSVLVRSFAWLVLLQDNGLLNGLLLSLHIIGQPLSLIYNRAGVLISITQVQLPLMVMPLYSVMARIDPNLAKAGATLGAGPTRTFLKVTLPLTLPGIISGCTLTFVLCLGYYVIPVLVGGRTDTMIGQLIVMQIGQFGNWGVAGALSLVLLVAALLVFGLLSWLVAASRRWTH